MSQVETVLKEYESSPEKLIDALQDVQDIKGYISHNSAKMISKILGVPLIRVHSVATFYKAFTLTPKGKYTITICDGTACHVRGTTMLQTQLKALLGIEPGETTENGMFTLESVNCLGACALGPVVIIDGEYFDHVTPVKLNKILKKYEAESFMPVEEKYNAAN
jgi:NADH-quinone oxidoreductase E subunit